MKQDAFIELLKTEFNRKKLRNKSYSLRSFSRDLEIDVSNLSKIMAYQKNLGTKLKIKIAKKIGLSNDDLDLLSNASLEILDQSYNSHGLELFQIVSDWQHYAILELFKLDDFNPTAKWISKRLNLTLQETKESILRLQRVGLLIKDINGKLQTIDESSSSILSTATSKAHRNQQRQILEGAIEALEHIPIDSRSQTSMTVAIDTQKLEEARKLIKAFRRNLGRLLSNSSNLDEVYQISISLYPISVSKKETKSKEILQ